uniref:ABC transmembrane type-1 domain-containing protein n=1 Tax=Megaselia scalaris TaxID=36166 RepID=T1GEA5_MEGSC
MKEFDIYQDGHSSAYYMFISSSRAFGFWLDSPPPFFNTNPSGRILNRFSKDMGQVDEILPGVMMDVVQIFLSLFGIVVVVAMVNPLFLIPTLVLAIIFYYLRVFYLKTSRDVKRIEGITRSPIYSHLGASLNGLATIRAFDAQNVLMKEF